MSTDVERAVARMREYLESEEFSGALHISQGDSLLFEHAGGLADRAKGVPNQIDTRFGIASITKMLTSAAICRLVDEGRAAFDTLIVELLSPDKRPKKFSGDVTLHHLLTHTSGIADYFDEVNLGAAAFDQIWIEHPSYLFTEPIHFLDLFRDLDPLREPGGDQASYCSAGFILLGLIIEELTGRSYISYIESEVFARAGMHDSGFFRLDDVRPRVAVGYVRDPASGWKTNHYSIPVVGGPDGGAFSTVRDLSRFLDALDSCLFFSEAIWLQMSTPHVDNDGLGYGYGMAVMGEGANRCFGHGGADPGFGGRAFRYPELDVNVTVLGNTIDETDGVIGVFRSALER